MLELLKNTWASIINAGVSPEFKEENSTTRLLNVLAFFSAFGALIISTLSITTQFVYERPAFVVICVVVMISYGILILLNFFHKIWWARFYLCAIVPLWFTGAIIAVGGNFSQGVASIASIVITYLLFEKQERLRFYLILYNILLFILASLYITFFGPLLGIRDIPFDNLVVYMVGLGWLGLVFTIYNEQKEKLIFDLKQKNKALIDTTEELERFSYIASHDLKSPLRTVVSFLGLIEKDIKKGNYEEVLANLEFAKSGAKQMNYIVTDILELSKINAPERHSQDRTDLNRVLEKVKTNLKEEIESRHATIESDVLPVYYCNEVEFLILFQNIIQNGIKYNKQEKPSVKIWFENNDGIKLFFKDNGIGIEPTYFDQIFQFFKRLHTSQEYAGTGLGLGLCKKIVEKYKGMISVKSALNEGSTFEIWLPEKNNSKSKLLSEL